MSDFAVVLQLTLLQMVCSKKQKKANTAITTTEIPIIIFFVIAIILKAQLFVDILSIQL